MMLTQMKLRLTLVVMFAALVQCIPNTADKDPIGKTTEETTWITLTPETPDGGKAGDPAKHPKGQYTLKFVPLIRIIASYLPRLLSRFTNRIQGGRSLNAESLDQTRAKAVAQIFAGQPCNTQHLGRWPNPHNVQEFFECAVNVDSMPTCSDVPSSLSRQIMQDLSMTHRSVRSIHPSLPEKNRLVKSQPTSSPVLVYKVNPCVSLVLHMCSAHHVYSSRLQNCIPSAPFYL